MSSVIAIVTGSRDWTDARPIGEALASLAPRSVVYHGGAKGADMIADDIARQLGLDVYVYQADWARHGKSAGPRRNRQMRDAAKDRGWETGRRVVCLAFPLPQSIGTLDMIALCEAEGWEVRRFDPTPGRRG